MSSEKFEKSGRKNLRKGILRRHRHDDEVVYFHKFFSKVHDDKVTQEFALLEFLNGSLIAVNIESGQFRFCSEKDFIEHIPNEKLLIAIANSTEEYMEDKIEVVNKISKFTPGLEDISTLAEKGVGHWKEGIVSGWEWNIKELLLQEFAWLRSILCGFETNELYGKYFTRQHNKIFKDEQ